MAAARCLRVRRERGGVRHGAAKMPRGEIPNLDKMLGGQQ